MAENSAHSVPDRWLNCPKIGSLIADIFVPFKTPLDEGYRPTIEKKELFWEPKDVIGICEARDINLGMIIDLTFSNRYYQPEAFTKRNIVCKKIACRGHNETPDDDAKQEFSVVCNGYLQSHPDKKIGVHCTHGFNRTGFLICAYLVEQLNWSLSTALITFQKARDPGIYKPEYVAALISKYGDDEDIPETAAWPTWEDPAMQSDEAEREKRSKEFMSGIPGVSFVVDSNETKEIQRMAADWCGFHRKGFPGSQPVSMDCDNVLHLKKEHHVVSWKADGTRYMMVIAGQNRVYFIDRDNAVFKVDGLTFPWKDPRQHLQCTLLDGEMVLEGHGEEKTPRYLIYDIVFCEKFPIRNEPFRSRIDCINDVIIRPRSAAIANGYIKPATEPFDVHWKEFYDVSITEKLLGEKFQSQIPHEIDGLIFQPSARPYRADRCEYILKWKPPELNTIDFRLRVEKTKQQGCLVETVGLLFVGGLSTNFSVLGRITREEQKLNGKIVECRIQQGVDKRNPQAWGWTILRERTDKSFPNSYDTAMGVMKSLRKPLTKEFLVNFIAKESIRNPRWREPPKPVTKAPESSKPPAPGTKRPSDFLVPQAPPSRPKIAKPDE